MGELYVMSTGRIDSASLIESARSWPEAKELLIGGESENGEYFLTCTTDDKAEILYLLERLKQQLMEEL